MGQWLSQQHQVKAGNGDDEPLKLVETWNLDHVQIREDNKLYATNRFSISDSGAIGISRIENPSLSVMYPNTDKAPVILSDKTEYHSATYVKISGKEYLAAACKEDRCLYLWDMESKTSNKVFDPNLSSEQRYKDMIIFMIDDNTIGYGEAHVSPDGSRRVFILKTDTGEMTLSSTLRLFTPDHIYDICYTEVEGDTACLLLCVPWARRVMAVEMIGGRTRWEVGIQQMGKSFYPSSICTDQNDCAYVADFGQSKIDVLSTADGAVIKRFDGKYYGLFDLFAVRFHDEHLYVEHKIPGSKYAISKFKEND